MKTQLLDMTGDGLADKVIYQDDGTLVYPNLGNRWDTTPLFIPRTAGRPVGRNVSISHGGGVNLSFGFNIPVIFIRLSFTGGGSYGTNTNRVEATFLDVDGDGNLDYVLSEDENDLRVAYSNIRRTNMLKRVETATGSWFEIDYERKMPTYENPNSQWVLKEVKVFDGYTGDGEDYAISRFEYNKPYYDRRERSFYGYGEVKQMQINPQDGTVLRTSVQEYYNEDFFRKSQLKKSTIFDKNGAKLSESSVTYHIADAQSGAVIPSNQLSLPQMDTKSVFIAPKEERERVYEQSDYLEKKTEKHYDRVGNIVKYIDHGAGTTSDGKPIITTLRAMGNMTFGANMRNTKPIMIGVNWYYSRVMGKVGEYNQRQNRGNGYNNGYPYFGEHTYSGSYIYYGYFGSFYKK